MLEKLGNFGKFSLFLALAHLVSPCVHAQGQFKILHNFGSGTDGAGLYNVPAIDKHGNLYGTTTGGGEYGKGIVYEIRPNPALSGEWTGSTLHSFPMGTGDGWAAFGGVTIDNSGNLYGTTWDGGANGAGVAFELAPSNDGWSETILYNFCSLPDCADGGGVSYQPIIGPAGSLYGAAGVLYQLAPALNDWTETVLYTFCGEQGPCPGGYAPDGALVRDTFGDLYGVTASGGYYQGFAPTVAGLSMSSNRCSPESGRKWFCTRLRAERTAGFRSGLLPLAPALSMA
jgi:uncharacterized repeat protein (TIGR03803 family)